MKSIFFVLMTVLLTTAPLANASATEPINVLRAPIDSFLGILKDPQYQEDTKKAEQREALWRVATGIFDFEEISRRALARNWRDFSPDQRSEFITVFSQVLSNAYISKMQSSYQNETVDYLGQEIFNETKAMVQTKILRESIEIPIDYYMFTRGGDWKVYDIKVEGVSLIRNYKTQFAKILMRKSPAKLIEQLKKKAEKQEADDSTSARRVDIWLATTMKGSLANSSRPGICPALWGLPINRPIAIP